MSGIVRGVKNVLSKLTDINPATLSGAIDVIATEHDDGHIESTPWHVRFGKLSIFSASATPLVRVRINNKETNLYMVVGHAGEAYFISKEEAAALEEEEQGVRSEVAQRKADSSSDNNNNQPPTPSSPSSSSRPSSHPSSPRKRKSKEGRAGKEEAQEGGSELEDDEYDDEDDDDEDGYGDAEGLFAFDEDDEDNNNNGHESNASPSGDSDLSPLSSRTPAGLARLDVGKNGDGGLGVLSPQSDGALERTVSLSDRKWDWEWGENPAKRRESNASDYAPGSFSRPSYIPDASESGSPSAALEGSRLASLKRSSSAGPALLSKSLPDMDVRRGGAAEVASLQSDELDASVRAVLMKRSAGVAEEPRERRGWSSFFSSIFFSRSPSSGSPSGGGDGGGNDGAAAAAAAESAAVTGARPEELSALLDGSSVRVELSACGDMLDPAAMTYKDACAVFDAHAVSFEMFASNPVAHTRDTSMIFRINGAFYVWSVAAPVIFSKVLFNRALPKDALADMPTLVFQPESVGLDGEEEEEDEEVSSPSSLLLDGQDVMTMSTPKLDLPGLGGSDNTSETTEDEGGESSSGGGSVGRAHMRLVPTAEELAGLDLVEGANELTFEVRGWRGTVEQRAYLYLWSVHSKVVITDVDGTVTVSDALGHVLPMLGAQWLQSGVAGLFDAIVDHGYKLVYLSSRAIGQIGVTRRYINWVAEEGVKLPQGPILISPDRLLASFTREVIRRQPEEFKIACLSSLRSIFPPQVNPFHAGFGNRITDAISYAEVGIPQSRIFIVNHRGEIEINVLPGYESSYSQLHQLKDTVFPSIVKHDGVVPSDEYNDFNFWRI